MTTTKYNSKRYRNVMFNAAASVCKCGEWRQMQVHHKDKNPNNNDISNLVWMCRKCHEELHGITHHKKQFHQLNKKYKKGTSKRKRK